MVGVWLPSMIDSSVPNEMMSKPRSQKKFGLGNDF